MTAAIRVSDLSKTFRLGSGARGRYKTLRDSITQAAQAPWRRISRFAGRGGDRGGDSSRSFLALDRVSFDVEPGEVLGIVGRNGAGKSTLLKILSRITEPSRGRVELRGRIGSLLEVGTGFHSELTGRENIYLNGAILGMSRREIDRKFDEIVAFAEVEQFLDTPVKRYSSGMFVRLAFAVAAHLELEVMVVDEVLAVGDLVFQRKCLGKMHEVSSGGRTVLFVSHNMSAVQSLCTRCLVLDGGRVAYDGDVAGGIATYGDQLRDLSGSRLAARTDRKGEGAARIVEISILDDAGDPVPGVEMGATLRIRIEIESRRLIEAAALNLMVYTQAGQRILRISTRDQVVRLPEFCPTLTLFCEVPSLPLLPGTYVISAHLHEGIHLTQDAVESAASFEVVPADVFGSGRIPRGNGELVFVGSRWSIERQADAKGPPGDSKLIEGEVAC